MQSRWVLTHGTMIRHKMIRHKIAQDLLDLEY